MDLGAETARLVHAAKVGHRARKNKSVGHEKIVGENVVVGESANDVAVVVTVTGGAVGLHQGPVGEVFEEDIGRIDNSGLFLGPGAASQRDVAGGDGGVAADVAVGLDQDYRRAVLLGDNGGGQSGSAGSNHHYVRFSIPLARSRGGLARRAPEPANAAPFRNTLRSTFFFGIGFPMMALSAPRFDSNLTFIPSSIL